MPEISNEDIREIVRERIGNILEDYSDVFKNAYTAGLAIDVILEIKYLAVVDRDAELPNPWDAKGNPYKFMRDEGWVKECL